jgi:hypothetical protein
LQKIQLVPETARTRASLVVTLSITAAQHQVLVLKNPDRIVVDIYRIAIIREHKNLGKGPGL